MYAPSPFVVRDATATHALMAAHGFATLMSTGPDGIMATHVPVIADTADQGPQRVGAPRRLVTHLARANPHADHLDGAQTLTIFVGPHGYVSPSWYAQQPSVPTWNYAAVHVHGRARRIEDAARLRAILAMLVDRYEAGRRTPWSMDELPTGYVDKMMNGIVGFEIAVERIETKHKLSQNRSAEDRGRVSAALQASADAGDRELADYMARHAPVEAA